jgi:hypothetical protein
MTPPQIPLKKQLTITPRRMNNFKRSEMKSTDRSAKRKSMGQSQLLLTLTQESI